MQKMSESFHAMEVTVTLLNIMLGLGAEFPCFETESLPDSWPDSTIKIQWEFAHRPDVAEGWLPSRIK